LPGYGREYFKKNFPSLVWPESANPAGWWNRGYELPEERPERARKALNNILEMHGRSDDRVALISHGGFYNSLMKELIGIRDRDRLWFTLNNTGVTRINFEADWMQLSYCNRTDFLPDWLLT
jgi:2,3-bisphosphoglycerate-dependent phosphoglycerate mutase